MTLDTRQESELVSGGDTRLHYHLEDRVTLHQLQSSTKVRNSSSSSITINDSDDIIVVGANATVTLPVAKAYREVEIIKGYNGGTVVIVPSGTDTIMATTSLTMMEYGSAAHLKAIGTNWMLI